METTEKGQALSQMQLEVLRRDATLSERETALLATTAALQKDAFALVRNDQGLVESPNHEKISELRGRLSGWHFSQESLTKFEREILYVGEQLMGVLDEIAGGYLR